MTENIVLRNILLFLFRLKKYRMDLTPRNIIAFIFSIYIIASGKLKKSIKKALKGDYILSIYFHNPTKKEFESIVKWLRKRGFHFISLSDLNKIATKEAPFPKEAVLITVDDGWRTKIGRASWREGLC